MTEFKFRFKTEAELDLAKSTGYIDDYPIVRFKLQLKKVMYMTFQLTQKKNI
jgi:hypothetical protein